MYGHVNMIYTFKCLKCKYEWETNQPMDAKHVDKCPSCGEHEVPSVVTGGGGFALVNPRTWNRVSGFSANDFKASKEIKQTYKEVDETLPKMPKSTIKKAHDKIRSASNT